MYLKKIDFARYLTIFSYICHYIKAVTLKLLWHIKLSNKNLANPFIANSTSNYLSTLLTISILNS